MCSICVLVCSLKTIPLSVFCRGESHIHTRTEPIYMNTHSHSHTAYLHSHTHPLSTQTQTRQTLTDILQKLGTTLVLYDKERFSSKERQLFLSCIPWLGFHCLSVRLRDDRKQPDTPYVPLLCSRGCCPALPLSSSLPPSLPISLFLSFFLSLPPSLSPSHLLCGVCRDSELPAAD